MSDRLSPRPRCDRCALPSRTCLCALVTPVRNEVEVLVLQHPAESREAKGSVRLLGLSLARCRVMVGESFEPAMLLELLGGGVSGNALLYPCDPAAADAQGSPDALPRRLVVLDGTWRKSLRMLCRNPLLQTLPRWSIAPRETARYSALRKARLRSHLSTLEATCAALAEVEAAPQRYAPLLAAFDGFVADRVRRGALAY